MEMWSESTGPDQIISGADGLGHDRVGGQWVPWGALRD